MGVLLHREIREKTVSVVIMNRVADGNPLVEKFIDNKQFYKGRDRYFPKNNGSTVIVMSTLVA